MSQEKRSIFGDITNIIVPPQKRTNYNPSLRKQTTKIDTIDLTEKHSIKINTAVSALLMKQFPRFTEDF